MIDQNEEYFDEELALSVLLKEGVLFANSRDYGLDVKKQIDGHTVVLFVLANDLMAWACADAQDFDLNDLPVLYKMWERDNRWGPSKWVCIKRNEKPQSPIQRDMKKDRVWDETMEKLPENQYDKLCKEDYLKNK